MIPPKCNEARKFHSRAFETYYISCESEDASPCAMTALLYRSVCLYSGSYSTPVVNELVTEALQPDNRLLSMTVQLGLMIDLVQRSCFCRCSIRKTHLCSDCLPDCDPVSYVLTRGIGTCSCVEGDYYVGPKIFGRLGSVVITTSDPSGISDPVTFVNVLFLLRLEHQIGSCRTETDTTSLG